MRGGSGRACDHAGMRRIHRVNHPRTFARRYWGAVALVLIPPILVSLVIGLRDATGLQLAVAIPVVVSIVVASLLRWRWSTHHLEVTDTVVVERRHPILVYQRMRRIEEITEVVPCPPERRGLEHGETALLLRCAQAHRDLVVGPEDPQQFLDDLQTAEPRFARYRGRLVREVYDGN